MPVTGLSLLDSELTFDLRESDKLTYQLTTVVAPENATDKRVTWASDNETVATVNEGLVTAIAVGTANITATAVAAEISATCVVTVVLTDGVMKITVDGISYSDLTIHNANNLELLVFTADGKLVATGNSDIPMSTMPAGTYLVRTPAGHVLKVMR